MLTKDGQKRVTLGHYQEVLYQKMDNKNSATIRAMSFTGVKVGKVKTVGLDNFQILEEDGDLTTINFDDILDLE